MSSDGEPSEEKTQLQSDQQAAEAALGVGDRVSGDMPRRKKREDLLERSILGLRFMALLLSFVGFVAMASNRHGRVLDFDKFEEYRYVLAVTIISTIYTAGQVYRHVQVLCNSKDLLQPKKMPLIDFLGDEVMAYLMISAASSGMPRTISGMRNYGIHHNLDTFLDSSATAIATSVMAFVCLALSALLSFYKLYTYVPDYI